MGTPLNPNMSLDELSSYVSRRPKDPEGHFFLGLHLASNGNPERAILEYRKSAKLDPKNWNTHYFLGITLFDFKAYDASIDAFRAALALKTGLPDKCALKLGEACMAASRFDEAVDAYKRVLRYAPQHGVAHDALSTLSVMDQVSIDRPANFQKPVSDEIVEWDVDGRKFGCRVRTFGQPRQIILLSESPNQSPDEFPPDATDCYLAAVEHCGLEDTAPRCFNLGSVPPLHFVLSELTVDYVTALGHFDTEVGLIPDLRAPVAKREPFSFAEFEALTGFRLFWPSS